MDSPYLGTRLAARLSPLRRGNLMSRLKDRIYDLEHNGTWLDNLQDRDYQMLNRAHAILGRLAALN